MLEQDSVVEMTRMRKVMDTGTLPSSQDMFRHFTKAHSRRFLPLARELEAASRIIDHIVLRDQNFWIPLWQR